MKPVYYKYLDLPDFVPAFGLAPGELIYDNNIFPHSTWPQADGTILHSCRVTRHTVDVRYQEYVELLVPELTGQTKDIGLQKIFNEVQWSEGVQLVAHTDGRRRGRYCLQYIFETGGDTVATTWWQEPGRPLVRPPTVPIQDRSTLIKLDEVIFDKAKWAVFRTDIIHSVQPIHTSRTAFAIGFDSDDVFDAIVTRYGVTE